MAHRLGGGSEGEERLCAPLARESEEEERLPCLEGLDMLGHLAGVAAYSEVYRGSEG